MKIKNSNILNVLESLRGLSSEKLPAGFAFRIKRVIPLVESQVDMYVKERRALIERYAKRDENNEMIMIQGTENIEIEPEFVEEFEELNSECGDDIPPLSVKQLIEACEKAGVNLSAIVLYGLSDILEDDVE